MRRIIALATLAAAPLAAQRLEVGLNISKQQYQDQSISGIFSANPEDKTVVAGRLGYALVDMGPALFQISAAFQPQSETTVNGSLLGISGQSNLKQGYWGAGLAFNFKALVAVGVGVDYRSEKLESDSTSTTYGRAWARANVGYAFPTPIVKPFIGLEVAVPLSKRDFNAGDSAEDLLKSLAPKSQIGVYGGIRF